MTFLEILFVAVALSMDAFAVSIACGISAPRVPSKNAVVVGMFFGGFQAFMPAIGWHLSEIAYSQIKAYDHWVAFFMLAAVGAKMIWDSFKDAGKSCECGGQRECFVCPLNYKMLLLLAVATSIDALAVGVSLSCIKQPILFPAAVIGIVAFLFTILGLKFGVKIGAGREGKFELIGGIVLVCIGAKIFVSG